MSNEIEINKIDENIYEIPKKRFNGFEMRVPVHIYANHTLLQQIRQDRTLEQIRNVSTLDGVKNHVVALSDAHQGYGFCIGAVAGTQEKEGIISPGGVGYDINCGVRLIRTNLYEKEIKNQLSQILDNIVDNVPSGLGSKGKIRINRNMLNNLLNKGLNWALEKGYAIEEDIKHCEENGFLDLADSSLVSRRAKQRGINQVGSLGSGNHFVEIQKVFKIYNPKIAKKFGIIDKNQICIMIHTGSRAFGHQICTDAIRYIEKAMKKKKIKLPDRELVCTPANSEEGQQYLKQMACAANFGFNNRQLITYWIRKVFTNLYKKDIDDLDLHLIYGVCHNILKIEEHLINGKKEILNIHRKGATRAFPKEHPEIPIDYRSIGQPVIIPGTMGTASYLCIGKPRSMELTFGSTAHGSGRVMSRRGADRKFAAIEVKNRLYEKGILIRSASMRSIAEESPGAYKDVDQVVKVNSDLGIVEKIAKLVPLGVLKG
jgi:tRNA-splicing ligase RtcB